MEGGGKKKQEFYEPREDLKLSSHMKTQTIKWYAHIRRMNKERLVTKFCQSEQDEGCC